MSRLEELIEKLCPDGVEYKTLAELGDFYGGLTGKSKEDFTDGNAKFITYMNIFNNPSLDINVADTVKVGETEKQNTIQYGDILFTGSSETPDECGMTSVLTTKTDEKLYLNSFCFGYRMHNLDAFNPGFLKHLFRSTELRKQIKRTASGVTRFNVSKKKMENVKIPVPPIEVQDEIVKILDNFTELTAKLTEKLTTELTARKKQYEYYRDELLTFGDDVPQMRLGDLCEVITKGTTPKAYSTNGVYFVKTEAFEGTRINMDKLSYIDEETHNGPLKRSILKENDILITIAGATIGKCVILPKEILPANTNQALAIVRLQQNINTRYVAYILQSRYMIDYISSNIKGSAQPNLNLQQLNDFVLPVPSSEEQQRIVDILDRFDRLCNNISEGLPAEIEARQKQYEYYRDKLLTFKEKG